MLKPFDLERIIEALARPTGWIELALVVACFAAAWLIDRRVTLSASPDSRNAASPAALLRR